MSIDAEAKKPEKKIRACFHLPGLRYNYPLNMLFLSLKKTYPQYFREGVEIASFFGEFPTSLWNGGRYSNDDQCNALYVREAVKSINEQGIPIRYTYTNPLLTEADLSDPYCNFCMQVADNGMNEVLVVSPILESYIRKKYPKFRINSSTCKEIRTVEELNQELDRDYSLVVLDYNLNNRFELLEQVVHKEKCEILVNSCCVPNCSRRGEHYRHIAKQQQIALNNRTCPAAQKQPVPGWSCEYGENNSVYAIQKYPTVISPEDIWEKYIPMGFQHFKIEGRTGNLYNLIETYCFYMLKPEWQGEGRMLLLTGLENSKILNRVKPGKGNWP